MLLLLLLLLVVIVIVWDPQRPLMEMGDSSLREDGVDLCCIRGRAEIALGMMMRRWRRSSSRRGRRRGRVG